MAIIYMTDQCCPCEGLTSPCCEPPAVECCMYPANQLGIGYGEADLPDSIRITIDGVGGDSRITTKSGGEYVYGNYNTIPILKLGVVGDTWQFIPNADNLSAYVQPCLVDALGGTTEAEFTVEDNFEDTYSYTLVFNGNTVESGTITRISLCIWSNTNLVNQIEGGAIFTGVAYGDATNSFGDLGVPFAWATYDGNDFKATKTPPQNSPEGTYIAVGGLYDGAVATVFQ